MATKSWDLREVLAAVLVLLIIAASPRAAAAIYGVAGALAIGWICAKRANEVSDWQPSLPTVALVIFASFALLSIVWSADRISTLGKSLYLMLAILGAEALIRAAGNLPSGMRNRLQLAMLVGLLVAFAFAAIESASGQAITRAVYTAFPRLYANIAVHVQVVDGVVTSISETNINRRVGLLTLLLWPTALLMVSLAAPKLRWPGLILVAVLSMITVWMSGHQSSQLAIVASVPAFILATILPRFTRRAVATAWLASLLFIVPLCALAFKANLHEAPWLFSSARHRIAIWGYTAGEVSKAPLLGIGADATNGLFLNTVKNPNELPKSGGFQLATTRHAHNGYLQIWYELGFFGASLLAAAGLAALAAIRSLAPAVQPFAIAQFATFAAIIATSYGIWQMWFQASIALGAVTLLVAAKLRESVDRAAPAPEAASGPSLEEGGLVT